MSIVKVDHIEQAKARIVQQYKNSGKFNAYIETFTTQHEAIEKVLFDLLDKRHLDVAVGAQLDVIGRIVGLGRTLINADDLAFFTLTDLNSPNNDPDIGMGDDNNISIGGIFRSDGQNTVGNIRLSDEQYRLLIRVKILKNTTNCSINDLESLYSFLFSSPCKLFESAGEMRLTVSRNLTKFEKSLFKVIDNLGRRLVPKPIGILLKVVLHTSAPFAFQSYPNAKGFDEGQLASQII